MAENPPKTIYIIQAANGHLFPPCTTRQDAEAHSVTEL